MSLMDVVKSPFKMANSFFNPDKPYEAAEKSMQDYWRRAMGFMQPYSQAGLDQLPMLTGAERALLNPAQLQGEWASQYNVSPEAQDLMRRSRELGEMEASSMGLAGSSSALENIQRTGSSIVSQDRQKFLDNLMQKYLAGIGIAQNIYSPGAGMAANLGQGAMNVGRDMSGLAYGRVAAPGEQLGRMIGMAAPFLTGGAGGAIGGAKTL